MSTDPLETGGKELAQELVKTSREAFDPLPVQEEQTSLFDAPSPEDMARSHKALTAAGNGKEPDALDVLDHARKQKRSKGGRRKGSQNRASKDFAKYVMGHGNRDPALVMAEIATTDPEVLVARSKALDPVKQRLTYGAAQALRLRAAEGLMPYMHGKKPVQVDLGVNGDFNLIIPGLNVSQEDADRAAEGSFMLDADYTEIDDGEDGA